MNRISTRSLSQATKTEGSKISGEKEINEQSAKPEETSNSKEKFVFGKKQPNRPSSLSKPATETASCSWRRGQKRQFDNKNLVGHIKSAKNSIKKERILTEDVVVSSVEVLSGSANKFELQGCRIPPTVVGNQKTSRFKDVIQPQREGMAYCCDQCPAHFDKMSALMTHMRSHVSAEASLMSFQKKIAENPIANQSNQPMIQDSAMIFDKVCYHCRDCSRCFKDLENLERHKSMVHNDLSQLVEIDVEHISTTFDCAICEASFEDERDLLQHNQDVHEPDTEYITYPCDFCDKVFPKERPLMSHRRSVHKIRKPKPPSVEKPGTLKSFICLVCDNVSFDTKRELSCHMKQCHTPRSFICTQCGRAFPDLATLRMHERNSHKRPLLKESRCGYSAIYGRSAEFVCEVCEPPRAFEMREMLYQHMETHAQPEEDKTKWKRVYACEECGELFSKVAERRDHMNRDHGVLSLYAEESSAIRCMDYSDTDCDETFTKPHYLSDHLAAVHRIGHPHAKFSCYICQKPFQTKCGLNNHVESLHSEKGPMPFQCQQCGRRYATKHNWRKHCKTHLEGTEYFVCKRCENKYLHKNSLKLHEKSCKGPVSNCQRTAKLPAPEIAESGEEIFPCNICNSKLKNLRSLRSHQRTAHWMYVKEKKITAPSLVYKPEEYVQKSTEYKRVLLYGGETLSLPRNVADQLDRGYLNAKVYYEEDRVNEEGAYSYYEEVV